MKVFRKSAFTLIELLVVIAIIALLISILTPALSSAREQAKKTKCLVHLKGLGVAIYEYAHEREGNIPWALVDPGLGGQPGYNGATADVDTWHSLHILDIDFTTGEVGPNGFGDKAPGNRGIWNLGWLYTENNIETGKFFYCPSTEDMEFFPNGAGPVRFRYTDYDDGPNGWPYGYLGDPRIRIGYNYYPQSKEVANTAYAGVGDYQVKALKTEDLNGSYTMVTDLIYQWEGIPHRTDEDSVGLNALFGDGHATYSNNYDAFDPLLWGSIYPLEQNKEQKPGDNLALFMQIISLLRP